MRKKRLLGKMKLYVLACLLALSGFAGIAPAYALGPRIPELPPVITLLEETPLYAEPDASLSPVAALSPQDVETVEAGASWYARTDDRVWIKIKTTWAGNLWVNLHYQSVGVVKPVDTHIILLWGAYLYTQPLVSAQTEAVLSPQTVHANAVFESPFSYLSTPYRIETSWLGDMWLVAVPRMLTNVEIVNQDMELPTETLYMEDYDSSYRMQRPSDAKLIPPQRVFAMEKTEQGVYHVRSQDGSVFWVHPDYAQPSGAEQIKESVELKQSVTLYMFPKAPSLRFGMLSPQTVTAFEKWTDPERKVWYHINTWTGSMWIQPDPAEAVVFF